MPMRASDHDRDEAVNQLSAAFAEGRITFSEFEERSAAAHAAVTVEDLSPLLADLPQPLVPVDAVALEMLRTGERSAIAHWGF